MTRKTLYLPILIGLSLSISACGGGGGSSTPAANNNNNNNPPPTNTLPTVKDTAWSEINRSPIINDVVYTGSKYIAAGKYGFIGESTDAQTWTAYNAGSATDFIDLATDNGTNIIAIEKNGSGLSVTTDGSNWSYTNLAGATSCSTPIKDIIHNGTQFVGVFNGNQICTSTNGTSWTLQTTLNGFSIGQLSYGNSTYVFSLDSGGLISKTALNTTAVTLASFPTGTGSPTFDDIIFGQNRFVGFASGQLYYSSDGNNWSQVTSPSIYGVAALSYSTGMGFVAVNGSLAYSSGDGVNWSSSGGLAQPVDSSSLSNYLVNGASEMLIHDNKGRFYRSTDLANWSQTASKPLMSASAYLNTNGVLYFADSYNLTEGSSNLYRSTDSGNFWSVIDAQAGPLNDMIFDGSQFVASGSSGLSYSSDGINWIPSMNTSYKSPSISVNTGTTTHYLTNTYINSTAGYQYAAMTSTDGTNFQPDNSLTNAITTAGGISGKITQAVSNGSTIVAITSSDILSYNGTNNNAWAVESTTTNTLSKVVWSGSEFVIVGTNGTVLTSTDGQTWTSRSYVNTTSKIRDIAIATNGTTFYALDDRGFITVSTNSGVAWSDFEQISTSIGANFIVMAGSNLYVFGNDSSLQPATMVYNGVAWSSLLAATDPVPGTRIVYDASAGNFLSAASDNTIYSSSLGNTWTAVSGTVSLPEFAYIPAASALQQTNFGQILFSPGATNSYSTGFALSTDGQNWSLNTAQIPYPGYTPGSGTYAKLGTPISTSTDGINYTTATISGMASSTPNVLYIKYVNNQYIAVTINLDANNAPKKGIYTSADGSNWTLSTELAADTYSQWDGNTMDIEYDGTRYLFLFHDQSKGAVIAATPDLQNFTLHETGITSATTDLVLEGTNIIMVGGDGMIASHAAY